MCGADGEGCGGQVASLEVAHVEAAMREGGVCFPVIIKPQIACGTEEAHKMVTGWTPPCWDGVGLMCFFDDFCFDIDVRCVFEYMIGLLLLLLFCFLFFLGSNMEAVMLSACCLS